jgi:homoserine kinase
VSALKTATAFAPATVANVAVGFDLLGFPIAAVGDSVSVTQSQTLGVRIQKITGLPVKLPDDPASNTATVGLLQLFKDRQYPFGVDVWIQKGIPLGSGMGGSAASSVAALVAFNALLPQPLSKTEILKYALLGELAASGAAHADNLAPCLYGGITFVRSMDPLDVLEIPVPSRLFCVLVHPHIRLDTRDSRKALKAEITLKDHVKQSANLGGFIAGCFKDDLILIQKSLVDVIVEPQRASLIPGFYAVQAAAINSGALGCSISGSGPSIFALASSENEAKRIASKMTTAFQASGVQGVDAWVSPIQSQGAKVIS